MSTETVETSEPEFMTVPEMVAWLRLDLIKGGAKNGERWLKDRCMPSHPERLPHTRFNKHQLLFSREQREEIKARFAIAGAESAETQVPDNVVVIDAKTLARAQRAQSRAAVS